MTRFLEFVAALDPKFDCPSSKTLRTKIMPEVFAKVNDHVQTIVRESPFEWCSMTTDIWTSASQDSYISLTMHYLDQNFQQKMVVLACMPFEEDHDAANVIGKIEQKLSEFTTLAEKLHVFVRDNAANMIAAFNLSDYNDVGCFIHILQVIIN